MNSALELTTIAEMASTEKGILFKDAKWIAREAHGMMLFAQPAQDIANIFSDEVIATYLDQNGQLTPDTTMEERREYVRQMIIAAQRRILEELSMPTTAKKLEEMKPETVETLKRLRGKLAAM